ncbi:expressed protein [Echinococcus multilocularis]|uniref:Expressed protein n=1 Tax=Echinococcus multilocularis TaxID=6211 RepID=A0A068Y4R6_ECHMU|nr:expressed protein [Echinococcus multilocularis]
MPLDPHRSSPLLHAAPHDRKARPTRTQHHNTTDCTTAEPAKPSNRGNPPTHLHTEPETPLDLPENITQYKEECTQQRITILMPTFRNLSCEGSPGDSLGLKVTE